MTNLRQLEEQIRDGMIEKTFIEPDVPGDPFEVSGDFSAGRER